MGRPVTVPFRRFCFCTARKANGRDGSIGPPSFLRRMAFWQFLLAIRTEEMAGMRVTSSTCRSIEPRRRWPLCAHELSGDKIGLYGVSRGAEHALLLASLMARDGVAGLPDAIAVHTPPDV